MAGNMIKYLIFALFVILLVADDGLCGPKKKKSKKPLGTKRVGESSSSSSNTKTLLKQFAEMKKREGSCFLDLDAVKAYGYEKYIRQIMKAREEVDVKLQACHETYERAIETRLEQLGIVGDAVREWLDKINELADREPNFFILLRFHSGDAREVDIIKELFEVKIGQPEEIPSPWIPFGSERPNEDPSRISEEEKTKRLKQTLLWRAYHMGTGVCTHLKEYPLWSLFHIIGSAQHSSGNHYQSYKIDLLPYEEKLLNFDDNKKLTMTGKFLALRYLCKHFNQKLTGRKIEAIGKCPFDILVDSCVEHADKSVEMFGLNGEFSVFVEDLECDLKKFYRLRESIRCLTRVETIKDIKKDLAMLVSLGNRLITGCLESLEGEIQPILDSIQKSSAYDEVLEEFLDRLGNYMKKDYTVYLQSSLQQGMSVRDIELSDVEKNFFLKEQAFDGFDILQGYLDGTKMCDLFKTVEWKHFINTPNKLLEFYEVLAEFSRTQKFRLEGYAATHPAMTIYQLWTMCMSIEIVPFTSFSMPSQQTTDQAEGGQ